MLCESMNKYTVAAFQQIILVLPPEFYCDVVVLGIKGCRPGIVRCPVPIKWKLIFSFGKCFVSPSLIFSSPKTFLMMMSPFLTRSWIHRRRTSMCRILPRPILLHMPFAAVESVLICILLSKVIPKSPSMLHMPIPIEPPFTIAWNSASPEDRAMVF